MNRYAAFLRGIAPMNPNMKNDKLRGVFEGLGLEGVGSVLSSGNIVFSAPETDVPALESRIQQALQDQLGIGGGTLIRSSDQLRALVEADPFAGLTHCRETYLTVTFLKYHVEPPELETTEVDPTVRVVGYDKGTHAVLWVVDNSTPNTPKFMAWLEKHHGKDITTRTFLTVQRVLKKL
ncbi:DUF1697 domain-containing protein [Nocardia uniformis]|uniref:DUF1697 domain-containing protein n=1 Tax=Nocardia uniformis TaxID=53432 RepID=A0A849C187_9NOCA|nr:DUF1697 domain-containing protein [Nocardia uniformis]NNH72513.1 DUF1697 domain-containing protein [Nocardia uniformis]